MNAHPNGIFMNPELYRLLVHTLNADTNLLKESNTMDYSLLLSIQKLDGLPCSHSMKDFRGFQA